jgi:integrase
MNTANIEEKCRMLIEYITEVGYSENSLWYYKFGIKYILQCIHSEEITSYLEIYRKYEKTESNKMKLSHMRSIIRIVEAFDLEGKYPNWTRNSPLIPRTSYYSLNSEYKAVIDYFTGVESKRGKSAQTIAKVAAIGASCFLKLQEAGIEHLADITEADILALFVSPDGTIGQGYTNKKRFAAVLKACIPNYPICEIIAAYLPLLKSKRKNIQYLTAEEIDKIKSALFSESSGLTLRDRAMGMLALYTGLRSSDIAGLKFSGIDWEKDILCIRQQKTDAPLTMPLTAVVGNAVWDYIEQERPKNDSEYVFISARSPYDRLNHSTSMSTVAQKIMREAGVRQNNGDRQGFHIFRHHFVSTLLGNGVPRPVISSLTGQTSPQSLDTYLSADFPHLKECAISIEAFPVPKEVFGI